MEKIICKSCGKIGYTASPEYAKCSCSDDAPVNRYNFEMFEMIERKKKTTRFFLTHILPKQKLNEKLIPLYRPYQT